MIQSAVVTVVVNNYVARGAARAEHGLVLLLTYRAEDRDHQVLLDTGQTGETLLWNLDVLKIGLDHLRAVVLSHGHYDHTGGLIALLNRMKKSIPVLAHPLFHGPRLQLEPVFRSVGLKHSLASIQDAGGELVMAANPIHLRSDVLTSGTISRTEALERNEAFRRVQGQEILNDEIEDDLALYVDLGSPGLLIVTGCCHAGLMNTVRHAVKITGNRKIRAIVGGLHLAGAGEDRLTKTVEFLKEIKPDMLVPLHCTGWPETSYLRQALGDVVKLVGVGDEIRII